jgi:hypothetical protein
MKISDLIMQLRTVLAKDGDVDVVSGLRRSGYGEEVVHVETFLTSTFNNVSGAMDGPKMLVVDLKCSDESLCEM